MDRNDFPAESPSSRGRKLGEMHKKQHKENGKVALATKQLEVATNVFPSVHQTDTRKLLHRRCTRHVRNHSRLRCCTNKNAQPHAEQTQKKAEQFLFSTVTYCKVMEVRSRKDEHKNAYASLTKSLHDGLGVPRSCAPFSSVLHECVLFVWMIVTKAKDRIRLQLFCPFPCWVGTEKIFP